MNVPPAESHPITRIFSRKTIEDKLGSVPKDAIKVKLPALVERITGEYYVVSHGDKLAIIGEEFELIVYAGQKWAYEAYMRSRWK